MTSSADPLEGLRTEEALTSFSASVENSWLASGGTLPSTLELPIPYGTEDWTHGDRLIPTLQQRSSFNADVVFFYMNALMTRHRLALHGVASAPHVHPGSSSELELEDRLERDAVAHCSDWGRGVAGVVGSAAAARADCAPSWSTEAGRRVMGEQLDFAAFLGLAAVVVPVPVPHYTKEEPIPSEQEGVEVARLAAEALLALRKSCPSIQIWMTCSALATTASFHRRQYHRVRHAMLFGNERCPSAASLRCDVRREAIGALQPFLRFRDVSHRHGGASAEWTPALASTEWLGEAVAGFELETELLHPPEGLPAAVAALAAAYPPSRQMWAAALPETIGVLHMAVELLRRRSIPVLSGLGSLVPAVFGGLVRLSFLVYAVLADAKKDQFIPFENTLQLPLQPLAHSLSSAVYEVFEQDEAKYVQYRLAMEAYVADWSGGALPRHTDGVPLVSTEKGVLHIIVLGCGRGPLIRECLRACTAHDVRAHVLAIEKNQPAAAYTAWQWLSSSECVALKETMGHEVSVIHSEGRQLCQLVTISAEQAPPLPKCFGWCDVVVSELLGSLGDNELSPECLDGFEEELRRVWQHCGIPPNPHLVCIPSSYTAWAAPLHSVALEHTLAETCIKGLTVCPPHCEDRHSAVYHQLLVSNLTRGLTLAAPQRLWSFQHFQRDDTAPHTGREARLVFEVPACRRISAFIGYFDAVLYRPQSAEAQPVTLSILPLTHTPDMFSWFPCLFPLDPRQVAERSPTGSHQRSVTFTVSRVVRADERRVWYTWSLEDEGQTRNPELIMNSSGWAASVYLS